METSEIKVRILRHPEAADWNRCKDLALRTIGRKFVGAYVTPEWKDKMLTAEHSPIRTLMFTIEMEIPYFVSVHFSRHYTGVVHYVQSQRNDRQHNYDRERAPQGAPVIHTMDINAQALMNMARKRLCGMADPTTRYVMMMICDEVIKTNPEFNSHLVPSCLYQNRCPEFYSCGYFDRVLEERDRLGANDCLAPLT